MKSMFDLRWVLFLGAAFSGFYFGDTQFSQASETLKPTAAEIQQLQANSEHSISGAQCVQLGGAYTLDSPSNCTDDSVMPDFLALGCSSGAVLPGQKLVIEQFGCEKLILKAFSMVDEKNEHPLASCEIHQMSNGEANRMVADEMFHVAKGDLEIFKSSQKTALMKKSLRSQIFFKAAVAQNPVKVQLKGGLKITRDGSLLFKTIKARKSDQLEKIQSACTLRRM